MNFKILIDVISFLFLLGCKGCGPIQLSEGSFIFNDPRPTGQLLKQGILQSQNNQSVSGAALIFEADLPNYIIRLEGVSLPNYPALQVWVLGASGTEPIVSSALKGFTGNQNYSFSAQNPIFKSVCIYSTSQSYFYGCAQLL